jgi:FlaA1/EpsC-like NDP-sugar epimerase
MSHRVKQVARIGLDLVVLAIALCLGFLLRFDWVLPTDMLRRLVVTAPYVVALQYAVLVAFGAHRFSWRFVGLREASRIAGALAVAAGLLLVARWVMADASEVSSRARYGIIPLGVIAIDYVVAVLGVTGIRGLRRLVGERREQTKRGSAREMVPTILVGAGQAGLLVARDVTSRPDLGIRAVGFVDDDLGKRGTVIHGVRVLGSTADLPRLCAELSVPQALITIAHASGADIRRIKGLCDAAGISAKIIPALHDLVSGRVDLRHVRDVAIEDLLRRDPVKTDQTAVHGALAGRSILVTGAGGSIGSELCRQIVQFRPVRLLMLERAETSLFYIHRELTELETGVELVPLVGDVGDAHRVEGVFSTHAPEVVFHAAAHKHVPMMECNVGEAVKNNVIGTRVVADAADRHGVEAFVMISTDKAVRPTSVMGATKRVAEIYVQTLAERSRTRFVSVRFGNVLGSQGSVVPIFRAQIERGGPVTVTHPEMTRYFMTIPEACQLVMQAATMGKRREIFILDMGKPVKIVDLARDLIRLSGLRPDDDIELRFTGIRPGEKMFEELTAIGRLDTTSHPDILVERAEPPDAARVEATLAELGRALADGADDDLRRLLWSLAGAAPEAEASEVSAATGERERVLAQGGAEPL